MLKRLITLICLPLVLAASLATADTKTAIEAAIASDIRSADDRARDENRRPLETLTFFQLREDMRVLELLPGGGWYTEILGPYLGKSGKY